MAGVRSTKIPYQQISILLKEGFTKVKTIDLCFDGEIHKVCESVSGPRTNTTLMETWEKIVSCFVLLMRISGGWVQGRDGGEEGYDIARGEQVPIWREILSLTKKL